MATGQGDPFSLAALNANETDLLLTALNSNMPMPPTSGTPPAAGHVPPLYGMPNRSGSTPQRAPSGESPMFASPNQRTPGSAGLDGAGFDGSPFLDDELDGNNFDWDINDDLIGGLPGGSGVPGAEGEHGDKRHSPDDGEDLEGDRKRHENGEKNNKKPGRKPLTSEPTTKRKAQNRAAQRAFRERKEKHLKDLETKVEELEKASEATTNENSTLKAQVDRLQTELKEYRRRLSLNSTYSGGSPTSYNVGQSYAPKRNYDISNNFQFDFPTFGAVEAQVKHRSSTGSTQASNADYGPLLMRNGSMTTSPFPMYQSNPSPAPVPAGPPTGSTAGDDFSSLFSPTTNASTNSRTGSLENNPATTHSPKPAASRTGSHAGGPNGPVRQNGAHNAARASSSEVTIASPASHTSNLGFASSSATTPESAVESPGQHKASETGVTDGPGSGGGKSGTQEDFASTAALGNPPAMPGFGDLHSIDWLANQNGGVFDPVLFGDYRDPQENIMNNDLVVNGFFNEAFAMPDLSAPLAANAKSPAPAPVPALPAKDNLMHEIEARQAGHEPEAPAQQEKTHFLTCNLLWERVKNSERIRNGEVEMDDLCSQLKSKAKCSGSGPVISHGDADRILGPAPDALKMQDDVFQMFK